MTPDRPPAAAACCPAAPSASPRIRRPRPAAGRQRCWPRRARGTDPSGQSSRQYSPWIPRAQPRTRLLAHATCTVWVGYDDGGALVFNGRESATTSTVYEYSITVAAGSVRQAARGTRRGTGRDVVDLVCAHVERDHGAGRAELARRPRDRARLQFLLVSGPMVSLARGCARYAPPWHCPRSCPACSTAAAFRRPSVTARDGRDGGPAAPAADPGPRVR